MELLILIGFFLFSNDQVENNPPVLLWNDEFEYEGAPDSTLWDFHLGDGCPNCGWGNNELQYYTQNEENVRVTDGKLIIEAHKKDFEKNTYTSTRLRSTGEGSWQYGYIEVRAKLPFGRGTWPAIWMLPESNKYGGWPASGEIDIMEHVGFDPGVVHGTVHTTAFNHKIGTQVGKQINVIDFDSAFHNYAINWTEEVIEFYLDGVKYHEFKNNGEGSEAWPFDHSFYLILNIAVGGGWGGQKGVDENIWPQSLEVEHVRVYEPLYTDAQKSFFRK